MAQSIRCRVNPERGRVVPDVTARDVGCSSATRRGRRRSARLVAAALAVALVGIVPRVADASPSDLPPFVGYNYGQIETPRTAAMSGALRAWGSSTGALFINPANMALTRVYHLGAQAQIWPEARKQSYGGAAVDSIVSSSGLAGGIGGTWTLQDRDGIDRTTGDLRFALAVPVGDSFFLGMGGRFLTVTQSEGASQGPLGTSLASSGLDGKKIMRDFTFDAGATLKLGDNVAIGVVGQNLSNPDNGFMPTMFGGGIGFANDNLTLEADVIGDFTTFEESTVRAMGGFEFLAGDQFPLRLGYRYDDGIETHQLSGGLGYIDQMFSAEASVRRSVVGESFTAIIIGFKYHLESAGLGVQTGAGF